MTMTTTTSTAIMTTITTMIATKTTTTIKNRIKNNRNNNSHPWGFGPPGRCLVMDEKDEMLELLVVVMEGVIELYGE